MQTSKSSTVREHGLGMFSSNTGPVERLWNRGRRLVALTGRRQSGGLEVPTAAQLVEDVEGS